MHIIYHIISYTSINKVQNKMCHSYGPILCQSFQANEKIEGQSKVEKDLQNHWTFLMYVSPIHHHLSIVFLILSSSSCHRLSHDIKKPQVTFEGI